MVFATFGYKMCAEKQLVADNKHLFLCIPLPQVSQIYLLLYMYMVSIPTLMVHCKWVTQPARICVVLN